MTDWHSHILPQMDDGSKSAEESIELLKALKSQGANSVVATPHFYANDETVGNFIKRRQASFEKISAKLGDELPEVLLGAEVSFYSGISRLEGLSKLKIQNTDFLLLEMPFSTWTEYTIRELLELASSCEFTVVLAHIERYLSYQNASVWQRLYDSGILMQSNASFFNNIFTRKKAVNFFKNKKIHFIGSDCHNMTSRPPELQKAYNYIAKKLGKEFSTYINENGKAFSYK